MQLNTSLSILLSILFALLLYYHDFREELSALEIVPLGAFNSD